MTFWFLPPQNPQTRLGKALAWIFVVHNLVSGTRLWNELLKEGETPSLGIPHFKRALKVGMVILDFAWAFAAILALRKYM